MKLGLDISGGDFAPRANVLGAILALEQLPEDVELVLIGREDEIMPILKEKGVVSERISVVNAPDIITMEDHPTRAIPQKPNSSISVGFELLAHKKIDSFASTGNTGAMLVGSIYKVNAIPGVIRPCITSVLPIVGGKNSIILDVGANADCKPDVLYQFASLGSLYAKNVMNIENPRVGLLNIGEEEGKGNLLTQSAFKLMKDSDDFNFIGNIEGRDLFNGKADVVVCDGFTGNIVLKQAEGIYSIAKDLGIKDSYFERFNYENYGGTPILGVNSDVIIGHGISNDIAVKNMMCLAYDVASSELTKKIKEAFT
ncbi:phosphate acyltransferase PlsX [Brumimicrobium glaciale]|jgi:glycerol-3-phosphate acyltransferase PlsX|uniref:Phosphate acyltransferase n=1 Tax=Brumimicrobium glaciale TaxID=200475 RepID=A0A4Q4KLB3_9FLAO|nr:phosphate acyltransferase PlsX [Brumimicrobium glaciale]RYM34183.1 phosphate acyltransferase PlsX [Brumimicrobium glaciale]